ncbi:ferrous iron transport protein A [Peptostreptococcus russellii]|uniref:Ferrous iron transport protein A n=1 Tax=Peptostreptococcus russellii TaxID=215200 RepID=A0A1H8KWE2_9FIRM|nr:FeoA family protein [Peptostreptococcus russellii]SEN96718.1 ferrous iron transport protein A [Peptostreptococcus russellii]
MTLAEGNIDKKYVVEQVNLPITLEKRMESLGMTIGSKVTLLQQKRNKTSVILIRGTKFAIGRDVASNIYVREA